MDKMKKLLLCICFGLLMVMLPYKTACADPTIVPGLSGDSTDRITDENRSDADADLYHYMNSMLVQYDTDSIQYKRLQELFNSAVYYIANTDMTVSELQLYVASVKTEMSKTATSEVPEGTDEFLQVADNWATPSVSYGQSVTIVLPIENMGTETLNELVIEPVVSTDVQKWPFVPDKTGYVQTEPFIPGYINAANAFENRREFTYHFKVRDDVMTGYYEIPFKISYKIAGVRDEEKTTILSVYVHTYGKTESGFIGGNGNEDKIPTSRIIVTGYETVPAQVYSGDTFNLTIHVQNTSTTRSVSNVLFELTADGEIYSSTSNSSGGQGGGNTVTSASTSVAPFLPTSGSNSIYVTKIDPGATTDLNIEMSAKSGLSQKSYVLGVNMTYDSGTQFDLKGSANISIPVYQEAKFDTSTIEVAPSSINVGSQSNLMFSIYNVGKTDLYNVQVQFEADSIENNMAFVGNLASGATGNVDIMLTGAAQTLDDGTINIKISYEDEAGNVTVAEKTANLYVNEIVMEDFSDMDMENAGRRGVDDTDEPGGMKTWIRVGIIAAAAILIIALIVFLVVRNKKKKAAAQHEQDLKDLEAIDKDFIS